MKLVLFLLLSVSCAIAQLSGSATTSGATYIGTPTDMPTISAVTPTASDTTISATFATAAFASPSMACGTVPGTYTETSVDSGIGTSLQHEQIVAGLVASTTYYCQISATNSSGTQAATFSTATAATPASTPITGLSFSALTAYNSINANNQGVADTFYNAHSNDGYTYFLNNDVFNGGWYEGTNPNPSVTADMTVGRWDSISPLSGKTINFLTGYGAAGAGTTYDGRSAKTSGLFAMDGYLFIWAGGQLKVPGNPGYEQDGGNLIWSADHGTTWNNYQQVGRFLTGGQPVSAAMFGSGPTTMGSATFVMYCGDDGTLGYTIPCNEHDNGNAFVYLIANDGYWNNGNAFYLARVPRAKLQSANASDYQFYVSGDGSLDSSWSTLASAAPILSNSGELGEPNVQYIPALNRYLLLTFYYPLGLDPNNPQAQSCTWLGYEAPHPWGPWTLINTTAWPTQGYYNPIVITDTAFAGTTPTIITTYGFGSVGNYDPYLSTMTIEH